MPRRRRIKGIGESYYHVTTRVIEKTFRFDESEKERITDLMRRAEFFSGVQVHAFCIMSNHLHLLVRVPMPEPVDDALLHSRIGMLYGDKYLQDLLERWKLATQNGLQDLVRRERNRYIARMYDLSNYRDSPCNGLSRNALCLYN